MPFKFELKARFTVSAEVVYAAWLDSEQHSNMTGSKAKVSDQVGVAFSAWDGYITGVNVALDHGKRILQQWRTAEFGPNDPPSTLEILLKDTDDGCELTLRHSQIPDGQSDYESGWEEHYFEPMRAYFGGVG